jgi:hypothetical protein
MAAFNLTAARLRELVHYEPETGVFTWLRRPLQLFDGDLRRSSVWNARYAGRVAGGGSKVGYTTIHIIDRAYWAHRLAWLYMTGAWPPDEIDHINMVKTDNRWGNLRAADRATNAQNIRVAPRKASDLPLGVRFKRPGLAKPYYSSLHVGNKRNHLGYFATPDEAHRAYIDAKRVAHPGFLL